MNKRKYKQEEEHRWIKIIIFVGVEHLQASRHSAYHSKS